MTTFTDSIERFGYDNGKYTIAVKPPSLCDYLYLQQKLNQIRNCYCNIDL